MSLGGFTSFAKNALLTAQKHIDSALHIEEEDEEDEEEDEEGIDQNEEDKEREDTANDVGMMQSIYQSAFEQKDEDNGHECHEKAVTHPTSGDSPFLDVDLGRTLTPPSQWANESTNTVHPIVDTEPNPIRDAHEPSNVFHYSPSSHSPDDEESSQNGHSSSSAAVSSSLDLSLINLYKDKEQDECDGGTRSMPRGASERTLDRFEDVRTIVSSDIEVIRQMDDWSVTSSYPNSAHQPNNTQQQIGQSTSVNEFQQSQTETASEQNAKSDPSADHSQQQLSERISVLTAKLLHRDQKIDELGRANESLRITNANLMAKNKQRSAAESKLQSLCAEKEKQLNELLDEGRKLSEYSGRQAKEIRKLKQKLEQLDVVSAARDSAVEELQEAHEQLREQTSVVEQLKDDFDDCEQKVTKLQTELDAKATHMANLEGKLCEQLTKIEAQTAEMKRTENTLHKTTRERDELAQENKRLTAKLVNRKAQERIVDERERGLEEDLRLERLKNGSANAQIRELEQRIESIQDTNRDIAVEISNANSPLLNTISSLEEKLLNLGRENDTLSRSARQMSDQLSAQRRKYEAEVEAFARTLEEERQNNAQKTIELTKIFSERADIQSRVKNLEDEVSQSQRDHMEKVWRMEQRMEDLEADIKAKRNELTELQRTNCELQQKLIASTVERRNNGGNSLLSPLAQKQKGVGHVAEEEDDGDGNVEGTAAGRRQQQLTLRHQRGEEGILQPNSGDKSRPKLTIAAPQQRLNSQMRLDALQDDQQRSPNDIYSLDIGAAEHLRSELDLAHSNLFQLHDRFENLLEMYGGCLETIEELKYDNEDLRKLCKEQALKMAELQRICPQS